jgi:hypothetical protein
VASDDDQIRSCGLGAPKNFRIRRSLIRNDFDIRPASSGHGAYTLSHRLGNRFSLDRNGKSLLFRKLGKQEMASKFVGDNVTNRQFRSCRSGPFVGLKQRFVGIGTEIDSYKDAAVRQHESAPSRISIVRRLLHFQFASCL